MNKHKSKYLLIVVIGAITVFIVVYFLRFLRFEKPESNRMDNNDKTQLQSPVKTHVVEVTNESVATSSFDPFVAEPRPGNVSDVVGYLAKGAFVIYMPDWIVQNWEVDTIKGSENVNISPRENIELRDYSDIFIDIKTSYELMNADTLYNSDIADNDALILSEVILNSAQDTRIYHVERKMNDRIFDTFYVDGNNKTAQVNFDYSYANYKIYSPKIREFVEGLGKGSVPQG